MTSHAFKLLLFFAWCATATHAETIVAGPKGGRLLDTHPNQAEFFVTADRKVEITFYDASLQPVAPGDQVITVTAEPSTGRTRLELDRTPTGFISVAPLPEGDPYRVVVQTRATPEARPKNFRVNLDLHHCGGCSRAEYACSCH